MPEYIPLTYGLEALYPPMKMNATQLREIYMRLADPCRFTEFRQLGEGQGGRLAEGNNRHLTITPDRFMFREEYTRSVFPTFLEHVNHILLVLKENLQVPVLLHSKVLIRALMPHPGQETTVEFFQQKLLSSSAQTTMQFTRPHSGVGIKLVFPPSNENHSTFQLRMEPYFQDDKMFFIENSAQFFDPITNFKDIDTRLYETNNFLKEQAGPFLHAL
jgi:hypothetical protein